MKVTPILPPRVQPVEFARTAFHAKAEIGTTKENILDPAYWAHIAPLVDRFSYIEVVEERGAWWAQLIVTSKIDRPNQSVGITVDLLQFKNLEIHRNPDSIPAHSDDEDYEIKFRGPKKWSVIHKDTREILVESLDSAEDAKKWVVRYASEKKAA